MPPALRLDQVLALAPDSSSAASARWSRRVLGERAARGQASHRAAAPAADLDHARGEAALTIVAQSLGGAP